MVHPFIRAVDSLMLSLIRIYGTLGSRPQLPFGRMTFGGGWEYSRCMTQSSEGRGNIPIGPPGRGARASLRAATPPFDPCQHQSTLTEARKHNALPHAVPRRGSAFPDLADSGALSLSPVRLSNARARACASEGGSEYVQGLTYAECATLLNVDVTNTDLMEQIYDTAYRIKERIYGNRIVLFAPLYIANYCVNNCAYCAFRSINKDIQ
eukprot:106036-Prorocentrum_minimum.AAC.1